VWVASGLGGDIQHYNATLEYLGGIPCPFEPCSQITGIAYLSSADTLLVIQPDTHVVLEIDKQGAATVWSLPLQLEPLPGSQIQGFPVGLAYQPDSPESPESIWVIEPRRGIIYHVTLDGEELASFCHPETSADCATGGSNAFWTGGLEVELDGDGTLLGFDVISGSTRGDSVIRINSAGNHLGVRISLLESGGTVSGFARGLLPEGPVFYVAVQSSAELVALSAQTPSVREIIDLSCDAVDDDVTLSWTNGENYANGIEVLRDGTAIAALEGNTETLVDESLSDGFYRYEIKAVGSGGATRATCAKRIGLGQVLRQADFSGSQAVDLTEDADEQLYVTTTSYPGTFNAAIARHPIDGSYLCAATVSPRSNMLYRYDADLQFVESVPAAFTSSMQTAGLTFRQSATSDIRVYSLGWAPAADPGVSVFTIRIHDLDGVVLDEFSVTLPVVTEGFVSFPVGFAHDESDDSFWLLESNSGTIVQFDPDGELLRHFPNPAQPFQDGVRSSGLWPDTNQGLLYVGSAGRQDFQISKLVELTRDGLATGYEVPLAPVAHQNRSGFTIEGATWVLLTRAGELPDLARIKLLEDIPAPTNLHAHPTARHMDLSWSVVPGSERTEIRRVARRDDTSNGETDDGDVGNVVAVLGPEESSFRDTELEENTEITYLVRGRRGNGVGPAAVTHSLAAHVFLRGNLEVDQLRTITDAINNLSKRSVAVAMKGGRRLSTRKPRSSAP
jgi:hypothetical protein